MINDLMKRAVVFACDFRPRVVGGVSVMPNHGRAAGAPAWLTLGDGTTTTTFPTPLAGWGASFDDSVGRQRVHTGVADRYDWRNQFSMYAFVRPIDVAGMHDVYVDSTNDINLRGLGFYGLQSGIGTNLYVIDSFPSQTIAVKITNAAASRRIGSAVVTYDGTNLAAAVKFYHSGALMATTNIVANPFSTGTIKGGKEFLLGGRSREARSMRGKAYAIGIFDGLLTPRDIAILDTLVRGGIR